VLVILAILAALAVRGWVDIAATGSACGVIFFFDQ
jgi:hypothetical protein